MTTVTEAHPQTIRAMGVRIAAGLFAVFALVVLGAVPALITGLVDPGNVHAMHDFGWAAIAGVTFGGSMIALAIRPKLEAPLVAVFALGVLMVALAAFAGAFDPFLLVFLVAGAIVWAFRRGSLVESKPTIRSIPLAAIAAVGFVSFVGFASNQMSMQAAAVAEDPHAAEGHYVGMAVLALLIPVLALIASTKLSGWRVVGWFSGVAAILFGTGSLVTNQTGQLETLPAVIVLGAGLVVIAVVETVARLDEPQAEA